MAAQAGILAAASILSRIIGLLYRSPLTAIIGDEGNGYYGTAINIYTIVLMVSSFGVPAAISKQMAQKMAVGDYKNAQKVFHCSMVYALAVGVAGSMLLYFGAGVLVPPNSVPVLQVFAPTVFLFGILGVLRGYFQANQSMVQTSVSQILEQIANAVVSILAAYLLMRTVMNADPTHKAIRGAMGSALGTGSGVLVALIFMTLIYFRYRGMFMERVQGDTEHEEEPFGPLMIETILVITPFILSSFIMNLTTSLNQTIFIKIMIQYKHWEEALTTTLYGLFSNKAVVRQCLITEVDQDTTLESHLYYLTAQDPAAEVYRLLGTRVKLSIPAVRKGLFGREQRVFKEEIWKIEDLMALSAQQKQFRGIVISEVQIPKLKLREFAI